MSKGKYWFSPYSLCFLGREPWRQGLSCFSDGEIINRVGKLMAANVWRAETAAG